MKKLLRFRLILLFWFSTFLLFSQNNPSDIGPACGTDELLQLLKSSQPGFSERLEHMEQALYDFRHSAYSKPVSTNPQILPVVVHIIHNNGAENLPDDRILKAIDLLNDGFAHSGFFSTAGQGFDVPFRFCLAQRDPEGASTTGITRTVSPLTDVFFFSEDDTLKNLVRWDPKKYINIWVVKSITLPGGTEYAGYATLPYSHGYSNDGIVMSATIMGHPVTAVNTTLSHEMGHYLGLYHTFEGGCTNEYCELQGDLVCDTPPDQSTFSTCFGFNSCSTDADAPAPNPFTNDVNDMTENYMDYTPYQCRYRFTEGQSERMVSLTEQFRTSLILSSGCLEPCADSAQAGFSVSSNAIVTGDTVWCTILSQNAVTYIWSVNGINLSTDPEFIFVPDTQGIFTIRLNATGATPNCLSYTENIVEVRCNINGSINVAQTEIIEGETLIFTTTLANADDFEWMINNQIAGSDTSLNWTFNNGPGLYHVQVKASNPYCTYLSDTAVQVLPLCNNSGPEQWAYKGSLIFPIRTIAHAHNGDVFVAGGNLDPVLIRLHENGDIKWFKQLKDTSNNVTFETITDLAPTQDNGVVTLTLNDYNGYPSLNRWDSLGNLVWSRRIPNNTAEKFSVRTDGNGLLFDNNNLICFNDSGTVNWRKSVSNATIKQTSVCADGGYLIHLIKQNAAIVCKITDNGEPEWVNRYSFPNVVSPILIGAMVPEADSGFTMAYKLSSGGNTLYVVRCNAMGETLWTKRYTFAEGSQNATIAFFNNASAGGYVGSMRFATTNQQLFFALHPDGSVRWKFKIQAINEKTFAYDGIGIADGRALIPINTNELFNTIFLMHTRSNGSTGCAQKTASMEAINASTLFEASTLALNTLSDSVFFPAFNHAETHTLGRSKECLPSFFCEEWCNNNGQDEDNDGYPDCYDSDCNCFSNAACQATRVKGPIKAAISWQSDSFRVNVAAVPIIANLNPNVDHIPEILIPSTPTSGIQTQNQFLIFSGNGTNLSNPDKRNLGPSSALPSSTVVIFDANRDKVPEIGHADRFPLGLEVYTDFQPSGTSFPIRPFMVQYSIPPHSATYGRIQVADFNGDGVPELFSNNRVATIDLLINRILVHISSDTTLPYGRLAFNNFQFTAAQPIAADVVSVNQCSDCAGLELIAGPAVYAIDLDRWDGDGYQRTMFRNLNDLDASSAVWSDGYTAVSDVNNDNRTDIIVSGKRDDIHGVYVWNVNGWFHFFPYPENTPLSGGMACIANVFDDRTMGFDQDFPEIIAASSNRLTCFNLNAATANSNAPYWWSIPTTDSTGYTAATAFDFNLDGLDEIVYQDQTHLRILYGGSEPFPEYVDDQRNWFSLPAPTYTGDQYPVVADCDGDGEAEIIFTSFDESGPDPISPLAGRLRVLKSVGKPWPAARPIWNQYAYTPSTVDDDLSIPAEPLAPWRTFGGGKRPYNRFLSQTNPLNAQFEPYVEAADAQIIIDSGWCDTAQIHVRLLVCNQGMKVLPAHTPLRVYKGNPTTGSSTIWMPDITIDSTLAPGNCFSFEISFPLANQSAFFIVANADTSMLPPFVLDSTFVPQTTAECKYGNNMAGFSWSWNTPLLNLGPDLESCSANAVVLDAGPGFARYRWSDGSIGQQLTALGPGTYWVDVWDACGFSQSDTLYVQLTDAGQLDLGPEQAVCPGELVSLTVTGFDQVYWYPAIFVGNTVVFTPPHSVMVYATGVSGDCFATDSVSIVVRDLPQLNFDVTPTQPGIASGAVSVIAAGGFPPYQYVWNNGQTTDSLIGLAQGWYAVTVTDSAGCFSVSQVFVGQTTSTQMLNDGPQLLVRPNPAGDHFQVVILGLEKTTGTCTVLNVMGQRMEERIFHNTESATLTFDCSTWPPGTYEILMHCGKVVWREKVVVNK